MRLCTMNRSTHTAGHGGNLPLYPAWGAHSALPLSQRRQQLRPKERGQSKMRAALKAAAVGYSPHPTGIPCPKESPTQSMVQQQRGKAPLYLEHPTLLFLSAAASRAAPHILTQHRETAHPWGACSKGSRGTPGEPGTAIWIQLRCAGYGKVALSTYRS